MLRKHGLSFGTLETLKNPDSYHKRTIKRFKFVTITHMNRIIVNILPWNCFENKHPLFILDLCLYTLFCE